MPVERWGRVKLTTIRRDFDKLREAIRSGYIERVEDAWLNCERWMPLLEARACEEKN